MLRGPLHRAEREGANLPLNYQGAAALFKSWIPDREKLARNRWLRPVAEHLQDDRLWHVERGSVARAVAIGLFFGFLLPVAQFVFAVTCAIWLRAAPIRSLTYDGLTISGFDA